MAISNYVTTTTNTKLQPMLVDEVTTASKVFATLLPKSTPMVGDRIKRPVKVEKNTNGKSYAGSDVFSTTQQQTRINLEHEMKFYGQPVTLSLTDVMLNNANDAMVLDLVSTEIKSCAQDLAQLIIGDFYGSASTPTAMNGLDNFVDDGTIAPTWGGQSRTTYPQLNSDVQSVATLTYSDTVDSFNAATFSSKMPNLIVCDQTSTYGVIQSFYTPTTQSFVETNKLYAEGLQGSLGFKAMSFMGAPIIPDSNCPSDRVYFLNTDYLYLKHVDASASLAKLGETGTKIDMSGVEIRGNDYSKLDMSMFFATEFVRPSNQLVYTKIIGLNLQLDGDPRFQAKIIIT